MPCVFPILALKAAHLARAGGDQREARRDALAYTAGAVIATGALGALLLAIRAGGSAAGWAFQLQDPRTLLLLLLLVTAITLNLLKVSDVGPRWRARRGQFGRARSPLSSEACAGPSSARPCVGFAAAGSGSLLVFARLG